MKSLLVLAVYLTLTLLQSGEAEAVVGHGASKQTVVRSAKLSLESDGKILILTDQNTSFYVIENSDHSIALVF